MSGFEHQLDFRHGWSEPLNRREAPLGDAVQDLGLGHVPVDGRVEDLLKAEARLGGQNGDVGHLFGNNEVRGINVWLKPL